MIIVRYKFDTFQIKTDSFHIEMKSSQNTVYAIVQMLKNSL